VNTIVAPPLSHSSYTGEGSARCTIGCDHTGDSGLMIKLSLEQEKSETAAKEGLRCITTVDETMCEYLYQPDMCFV
jgi:hypothetical protein